MSDDTANSEAAALQARFEAAISNLLNGNLQEAETAFNGLLAQQPGHAGALNGLGLIAIRRGDGQAAEAHWTAAVQAAPGFAAPYANLGGLLRHQDPIRAADYYQKAMALDPKDPQPVFALATLLDDNGQHAKAVALADEAIANFPDHAGLACLSARGLLEEGRADEALARVNALPIDRLPPRIAQMVHYTRVQIADRLGDEAGALAAAAAGAKALRALYPQAVADAPVYMADMSTLNAHFAGREIPGDPEGQGQDLFFLIGFPSSGSEPLGNILAHHPVIQYRGNSGALMTAMQAAFGAPAIPRNLDADTMQNCRQIVENGFQAGAADKKVRVDHVPLNILLAGFAAELFPAARFILVEREAEEACLAASLRGYELSPASANLLCFDDAAKLYELVQGGWSGVAAQLADRVFRVSHHEMELAPRQTLEAVLDFLGLGGTASAGAVSALENRDGPPLGSWRRYERVLPAAALARLEPLKTAETGS